MPTESFDLIASLRQVFTEDSGQDIIEYALLAAVVGVASLLIWQQIATEVGIAYTEANSEVQDLSCMPGPDGTGCP